MENKKEIWGYTAIFDPKLVGLQPFIILIKADLSKSNEDLLKKVTSKEVIRENEEIHGFQTTMFLHGLSDIMVIFWAKDIIEANKLINNYRQLYKAHIKGIELYDVLAIPRSNCIANPKMIEELTNLII